MGMKPRHGIALKRAYDAPAASDEYRVLVDRVWPRGASKEGLKLDEWAKDLAPSSALRKWFGHDPAKWPEFKRRYLAELEARPETPRRLARLAQRAKVTLVFGAKDPRRNNAVALKEYLERQQRG